MCYTSNVNYEFYCWRCDTKILEKEVKRREGEQEGEEEEERRGRPCYRGETSRTPYTRAQAHFSNYLKGRDSFMHEHTVKEHEGEVRGGAGRL